MQYPPSTRAPSWHLRRRPDRLGERARTTDHVAGSSRFSGVELKLKPSMLPAFGLDLASSLLVFIAHILTLDTMFASTIAVVSVLLCDTYALHMAMDVDYGLVRSAGFECMQN